MVQTGSHPGYEEIHCHRFGRRGAFHAREQDAVVVEEPLEMRLGGTPVVTVMRTPGHDRDLALGLFHSEGWIRSLRDIEGLVLCSQSEAEAEPAAPEALPASTSSDAVPFEGVGETWASEIGNVVDLLPAEHVRRPATSPERRPVMASCGVCGKRTIEEVLALVDERHRGALRGAGLRLRAADITRFPAILLDHQTLFKRTGALHGAALFDREGTVLIVREDVGRHNAVDKVIGWSLLEDRLPLSGCILQVSGRVSFEIVQKAYLAGISIILAVSGVSTLAASLAADAGITLVGFLRGDSFNVYSHPERIQRG